MPKEKTEAIHEKEVQTGELAAIVGKSDRWIRQLVKENILHQVSRGKFTLGKAVQSYIEHASGGKEDDKKPRFIDHKTEHERIKSEKAALELAQMRGELHASEDVETVMSDMLTAFRQKILALPTKLAPQLAGIEDINVIKGRLASALHEALAELSDYDPVSFREGVADSDAET